MAVQKSEIAKACELNNGLELVKVGTIMKDL